MIAFTHILQDYFSVNWGHFYWHGLTLIPEWISEYVINKVWDEITYPFPNISLCMNK